jgi:hypothetical protein
MRFQVLTVAEEVSTSKVLISFYETTRHSVAFRRGRILGEMKRK